MRPTYRVAWSIALSVGLSVTVASRAKTAEPIEMTFELLTRVGPRHYVLDGSPGPDHPWEEIILGEGGPIVKYRDARP